MPISERAKQFAPFSALTGLEEALARKEAEHSRRERIEIGTDGSDDINRKLSELYVGDFAEITYYSGGHYKNIRGEILAIDCGKKVLCIQSAETKAKTVIHFKDLYRIK